MTPMPPRVYLGTLALLAGASVLSWLLALLYFYSPAGQLDLELSRGGPLHPALLLPALVNVLVIGFERDRRAAFIAELFLATSIVVAVWMFRTESQYAALDCDHESGGVWLALSAVQLANAAFGAALAAKNLARRGEPEPLESRA